MLESLFLKLWHDYSAINSQAKDIHELLSEPSKALVNDHVAFRTFNHPRTNISKLAKVFLENGYEEKAEYRFEQKKLVAIHLEYPEQKYPKVFISELLLEEFSDDLQGKIKSLIDQMPSGFEDQSDFCVSGRPWNISYADYESFEKESEYAAWMSAFGFRANHFTVSVNDLSGFQSIVELNAFLKENGFILNSSGGEVKGTEEELLEQSSTLAARYKCKFDEGLREVPSCYYEFAKRYPDSSGKLFQGFIAKSADKIFESTDRKLQF